MLPKPDTGAGRELRMRGMMLRGSIEVIQNTDNHNTPSQHFRKHPNSISEQALFSKFRAFEIRWEADN